MSRTGSNLQNLAELARNHIQQAFSNASRRNSDDGEDNRPKVAQVVEQVFQTLFAPCVNLHTEPRYDAQPTQLLHKQDAFPPHEDSYYAQFFQSSEEPGADHGRTARAILLARQQEELAQVMAAANRVDPVLNKDRFQGREWNTQGPLAKNIHVPTNHAWEIEDDGVSALSAHTLEDMARLQMRLEEAVLRKKGGQHGIHVKAIPIQSEVDPPSPASTENSEHSQQRTATSQNHRGVYQTDAEDWLDVGQTRTHSGRMDGKRSSNPVGTMLHPHDTFMAISAQDVVPKRTKKTAATPNRNVEYEEDMAEI